MNNEESIENNTLYCRFYNHLKQYYMIFGIVGLIIAGAIGFSLLIGFITFNLIVPIAQMIPPWGYAVVGIVSLPTILALIHTFFETDCECRNSKKYPRFEVEIQKTGHDYSWVFLTVYSGWGAMRKCIATKTPKNNEARSVANYLIKHAEEIYNNYKNKPSGTFTEPLTTDNENQNNESLKQEIEELKRKVEELSNNKTKSKPMSELEKQNIENNSK